MKTRFGTALIFSLTLASSSSAFGAAGSFCHYAPHDMPLASLKEGTVLEFKKDFFVPLGTISARYQYGREIRHYTYDRPYRIDLLEPIPDAPYCDFNLDQPDGSEYLLRLISKQKKTVTAVVDDSQSSNGTWLSLSNDPMLDSIACFSGNKSKVLTVMDLVRAFGRKIEVCLPNDQLGSTVKPEQQPVYARKPGARRSGSAL